MKMNSDWRNFIVSIVLGTLSGIMVVYLAIHLIPKPHQIPPGILISQGVAPVVTLSKDGPLLHQESHSSHAELDDLTRSVHVRQGHSATHLDHSPQCVGYSPPCVKMPSSINYTVIDRLELPLRTASGQIKIMVGDLLHVERITCDDPPQAIVTSIQGKSTGEHLPETICRIKVTSLKEIK